MPRYTRLATARLGRDVASGPGLVTAACGTGARSGRVAPMEKVKSLVRAVPDFPKPGILFRDITPVLEDPEGLRCVLDAFAQRYERAGIKKIAGIESRGFIFGSALADRLGCGLVLVRKPGKLPRPTHSASYALEYGTDSLHIHQDAVTAGERVLVIDDLIATGGTAAATVSLLRRCGAHVHEVAAVIELQGLGGRSRLSDVAVHALLTY